MLDELSEMLDAGVQHKKWRNDAGFCQFSADVGMLDDLFPVPLPRKNVQPSNKCQKQAIYQRTYALKKCWTKRPTSSNTFQQERSRVVALDEQDYDVFLDIAKSLRRIADV